MWKENTLRFSMVKVMKIKNNVTQGAVANKRNKGNNLMQPKLMLYQKTTEVRRQ